MAGASVAPVSIRAFFYPEGVLLDCRDGDQPFLRISAESIDFASRTRCCCFVQPRGFLPLSFCGNEPFSYPSEIFPFLNRLINCDADQLILIVAWMVAALRRLSPMPILALVGDARSGKSFASRAIRSLIDPSSSPLLGFAGRRQTSLGKVCSENYLICLDDVGQLSGTLASELRSIRTGVPSSPIGDSFDFEAGLRASPHPILINCRSRAILHDSGLADSSIVVELAPFDCSSRRPEAELISHLEGWKSDFCSALVSGVQSGLASYSTSVTRTSSGMDDFAKFSVGALRTFQVSEQQFLDAYDRALADAQDLPSRGRDDKKLSFLDRLVAWVLSEANSDGLVFSGSASELAEKLKSDGSRSTEVPSSVSIGRWLTQESECLRKRGVVVEKEPRTSHKRAFSLSYFPELAENSEPFLQTK